MKYIARIVVIVFAIPFWIVAFLLMPPIVIIGVMYKYTYWLDGMRDFLTTAMIGGQITYLVGIYLLFQYLGG